jgi:hypothetical protein
MTRVAGTTIVVVSIGAACAGCASAPMQSAGNGAHTGAYVMSTTGTEIYHGAGAAVRAPLHDLNMAQDQIPPVLLRAEEKPYDLADIDTCNDVLAKVAELDLALGPDVDMPKESKRTRASRGADFAAEAALDAAGSAVEHFIPMRSTIKQLTGATRYENHVKHAILSGEVRRSFLKTVGMAHNCTWPAAPLAFKPTQVADAAASWSGKAPGVMLASAKAAEPAVLMPAVAIQTAEVTTEHPVARKRHHKSVSADQDETVQVASANVLVLPPVAPPAVDASQTWRPPTSATTAVAFRTVSTPVTASAAAPWSSFASH